MKRPILACITAQPHCENIVSAAKKLALELSTDLYIVTVLPVKETAQERAQKLKCLKNISKKLDVDIIIRYSDNPASSVAAQARMCQPMHIFIGEDNGFLNKLFSKYNKAPISIVSKSIVFTVPMAEETKGA
jgi:K+-sensing histidine kinase KdpD